MTLPREIRLLLSFVYGVAAYAGTPTADTETVRYMQCGELEAELMMSVTITLPGPMIAGTQGYFRSYRAGDAGIAPVVLPSIRSQRGTGDDKEFSFLAEVLGNNVLLTVSETGHSSDATSSLKVKIIVPFGADRKGSVGGIGYKVVWVRGNQIPRRSPNPISSSVTPPAGQEPRHP